MVKRASDVAKPVGKRKKTARGGCRGAAAAAPDAIFACPVCRGVLEAPVTVACGHTFCKTCVATPPLVCCYVCRTDVAAAAAPFTDILVRDLVEKWKESRAKPANFPYCLRSHCNGNCHLDEIGASPILLAADFDCILCGQCLLRPVTTTCGHTFCRECLARVLDHGLACPLCVYPLGPPEQQRSDNALLTTLVGRETAANEETTPSPNTLPIFICTNAFPTVACPLFVYEPKYRLLARRCLNSTTRRFGMAAKTVAASGGGSNNSFAVYGTLLEIRDSIGLEDGTSILTTVGLRRFKVLSRGEQDGYDTATVQYIRDQQATTDKLDELHERVHAKTLRWLKTLKPRLLDEIERCIGSMPDLEDGWRRLPDGPAWTWWLVAILPLGIQLRVGFLASTSLPKRLLAVEKMLDHLKIRTKAVEGIRCDGNAVEAAGVSCETIAA